MCWVVCSSGFWCLECLGFEVLRAKVFYGFLGFRVFRVVAFWGVLFSV